MAKRAFIALLLAVFIVGGYFLARKKTAPTPPPSPAESGTTARPSGPRPGIEFHDIEKQRRYEQLFHAALDLFQQPGPGEYVWVRLWDGRLAGGKIVHVSESGVSLAYDKETTHMDLTDLAMESRELLFPTDFARAQAMRQLTGEAVAPIALAAVERFPLMDDIEAHRGPGISYQRVRNLGLMRGQPIRAIQEQAGWIRLERPAGEPACWIPKCMTRALDELHLPSLRQDIESLKTRGIVAAVIPEENLADVDRAVWQGTDPLVRMGLARTLAAYCAAERGNNLQFVTVRDRETQRKLGKYSQSQGWKDDA